MSIHPLTKDGAAMMQMHNGIWGLLGNTEYDGILRDWDDLLD